MIKVKENKYPQHLSTIEDFLNPSVLYLPLSQHTGVFSQSIVNLKQEVEEGELIAKPDGYISSALHSPIRGIVSKIDYYNHPILKKCKSIVIKNKGEKNRDYLQRNNIDMLSENELIEIVKNNGIVGLGGAVFPTHVKLKPTKKVDTLIINGCECEPYLACDYRLMVEHSDDIFKGVELISRILKPKKVIFGIEDNKPEAIKLFNKLIVLNKSALPSPTLKILDSRYPQGGEKQLIFKLTQRKVPSGGLPFDVGCTVFNVGTAFAIFEAVYFNKPLIERVVTFAGRALKEPKNLRVKIGTTLKELFDKNILEFSSSPVKIVVGGPMMGISIDSLDYPILKGTGGVLFLTEEEIDLGKETNCLRCARCVDVCPMNLLPLEFVKRVKKEAYDELGDFYIMDCIECGCCTYVCPAKIPLVHYIKIGKIKWRAIETKR